MLVFMSVNLEGQGSFTSSQALGPPLPLCPHGIHSHPATSYPLGTTATSPTLSARGSGGMQGQSFIFISLVLVYTLVKAELPVFLGTHK